MQAPFRLNAVLSREQVLLDLALQLLSFRLNRTLLEGEQIDLSTMDCTQYLSSPVGGDDQAAVAIATTLAGNEPDPIANACFTIGDGNPMGGCFEIWHHSLNGQP